MKCKNECSDFTGGTKGVPQNPFCCSRDKTVDGIEIVWVTKINLTAKSTDLMILSDGGGLGGNGRGNSVLIYAK